MFVYLCRCSIEQSKGGGRSKRGHCAICSSNTLTAAKCVLVKMVVLKLPVQSRARSRGLSVFTVQAFVKIMFLRYSTCAESMSCCKAQSLSRVDSVEVDKK